MCSELFGGLSVCAMYQASACAIYAFQSLLHCSVQCVLFKVYSVFTRFYVQCAVFFCTVRSVYGSLVCGVYCIFIVRCVVCSVGKCVVYTVQ